MAPDGNPGEGPRLLADIGGTKARFALEKPGQGPADVVVLYNREHASVAAAARTYLEQVAPTVPPRAAALSVACPVSGDDVQLTNFGWSFSIAALQQELGLDRLEVINDFSAVALSVPTLGPQDVRQLGRGGPAVPAAAIGVLGAGTGLGVSGLVSTGDRWIALAGEGGHAALPTSTDREAAVVAAMRQRFAGHVSAERAISGPGLVNLYEALCTVDCVKVERLRPRDVSAQAAADPGSHAAEAAHMFSAMLGTVAADLALTLGARGGVYIAGGVIYNMGAAFDAVIFRDRFEDKGRMSTFVRPIPTFHVTKKWPAFAGLAAVLDHDAAVG